MSSNLSNRRILITGVGYKPVRRIFRDIDTDVPSHSPIIINGTEYKANIGTATALACVKEGAAVHLVARSQSKLMAIREWLQHQIPGVIVDVTPADLNDGAQITRLISQLREDLPLYWVQSVGLGAGTVKLQDDNPYLLIEDISDELISAELSVLWSTIMLFKALLPRIRNQAETRVCIVSSMSAVRSVWSGSIHMAAKGAISRFANAAMLELDPERIFVTEVRPGGVDTGLYDTDAVLSRVLQMAAKYGYMWSAADARFMPPSAVGEVIAMALASPAHMTSINMVARGQWPHDAS